MERQTYDTPPANRSARQNYWLLPSSGIKVECVSRQSRALHDSGALYGDSFEYSNLTWSPERSGGEAREGPADLRHGEKTLPADHEECGG